MSSTQDFMATFGLPQNFGLPTSDKYRIERAVHCCNRFSNSATLEPRDIKFGFTHTGD
jgi:hypothetical protein